MKSLSMRVLRSIAVGVVLCEPLLLWCATGEILQTPQPATGRPAERIDIEALQKLAQQEGESGQTTAAIRDYQRALELRPEWKEGWWNLEALQYSDDRYATARSTLLHLAQLAPALGAAWRRPGLP